MLNTQIESLRHCAVLVFLTTCFAILSPAVFAQTDEIRQLSPNQIIEREIVGAETHRYRVELQANEFFQVRVEQKGADVFLKLLDADGTTLATMDNPNGKEGFEILSFAAGAAGGKFVLEVGSSNAAAAQGNYTLRREAARTVTEKDQLRVRVEREFVEAVKARDADGQTETALAEFGAVLNGWRELGDEYLIKLTVDNIAFLKARQADALVETDKKAALILYEAAKQLFTENGNKPQIAEISSKTGDVYESLNEPEKAIAAWRQAIENYEGIHRPLEMISRSRLGRLYFTLREFEKAREFLEPALTFFQNAKPDELREMTEAQRKFWASSTSQILAITYLSTGETEKALALQIRLAAYFHETADTANEAIYTSSTGTSYNMLGRHREAIPYFEKALQQLDAADLTNIEKSNPNIRKQLKLGALNGIGQSYTNLGDWQKALDFYQKALALADELGDKPQKQSLLLGISGIYESLYQSEKAFDAANESFALAKELNDQLSVAFMLNLLGRLHMTRSENRAALAKFEEALTIARAASGVTEQSNLNQLRRIEASALNNIGIVYSDLGENEKALEYYAESLKLHQETNDKDEEATTYTNIAFVYSFRGEMQKALEYLKLARDVFAQASPQIKAASRVNRIEANSYINFGMISRELGNLREAADFANRALEIAREKNLKDVEASALNSLGNTYSNLGELQKSLECYRQALNLRREISDKSGEIYALVNIGNAEIDLGETAAAAESFAAALKLAETIESIEARGIILAKFGRVYFEKSEYVKALDYYNQSLVVSRKIEDIKSVQSALADIGIIYAEMGEREKAIDFSGQALKLVRETGSKSNEAILLNSIGKIYFDLGENKIALDNFRASLKIAEAVGDKVTQAGALILSSKIESETGDWQKAAASLERALSLTRETGYKSLEITALRNLGIVRSELGDKTMGASLLNESLALARKHFDRFTEGRDLASLGKISLDAGDAAKARELANQALQIAQAIGDKDGEAAALKDLMTIWKTLRNEPMAIFYGKQSVNKYQSLRGSIHNLDKQTQESFRDKVTGAYRDLANLLIENGRLPEAQAVLDLLKDAEFRELQTERGGENVESVPYSQTEAAILEKVESLAALERERAALLGKDNLSAGEQARLDKIGDDIETVNAAFQETLKSLNQSSPDLDKRVAEIESEVVLQSALEKLERETKSGTVALYTLLGTGEKDSAKSKFGWVILVKAGNPAWRKAYPIDVTNLEQNIQNFRAALSSDKYDPQPLAEKIYNQIFRQTSEKQKQTLEADLTMLLADYKDKTLMWSLDGVLRYIPMAALHDGKNYLVEKYRTETFTRVSFPTLTEPDTAQWKALGLGVSERREGFDALPGAEKELRDIVKTAPAETEGIFDGAIKINDDFKKAETISLLRRGLYPVIHIASHYSFNPSDNSASYLLVGDGNLTFGELKPKENLFGKVELLTLSACDTAMGGLNGEEAEGFAYLAQSLGAKAVIASLWKVSDKGTSELMVRFYELRKQHPEMAKGEAFRQAQLSLLQGTEINQTIENETVKRTKVFGADDKKVELPPFVKDEKKPFAHPYYWSSFVLIGNWR